MISIIIPTLNEEKNLSRLLSLIKRCRFDDSEIIIADAGSKDRTVEIAKENGCIVVPGGLPARGRNSGAEHAKGDILFFMDADLEFIPNDFLQKASNEFKKKKLSIASFPIFPIKSNVYMNHLTLNLFYNIPQAMWTKFFPMGAMGIMTKKDIFEKIGGFDETISLAEDHYFVQQCAKISKFGVISSVKILMPLRRFEKDGYFRTAFTYLKCGLNMFFLKKPSKAKYEFNHYDKK
ncbi:MAG: glycosyltransferase [Candidatus Pacebacteria bacterium]|nr:glycosyltransferase [Candidatus Paceibacterota bacterium]